MPPEQGSENRDVRAVDNSDNATEERTPDLASSDTSSQGSNGDRWDEDRWGGYDEWDQEDYSDPFW